ncbi:UrvD/REP family ATP-dependent DNA helicase [Leucobacter ruminantium]|uniref:DNA 3'-5' helicase n=1 Tax=Leucobacter ruminantium TaxID=1289170 RepID=A0A939LS17_9MICO|nr:UrvD/REP family ATP-dependent DNA helicase [Leucobacter ruminantium]MBO1803704.1 ATP-dependent helicase [Leucobacter ruminantium]
MIRFDPAQLAVLAFDPDRHARVLGAPGSGKSSVLVEAYARVLERPGRSEADVLAIAPNRLAAAALRGSIESRARRALGGTPARTPASLAFAVLAQAAAASGDPVPRLLTGTAQDEAIAAVIEDRLAERAADGTSAVLVDEVLRSPAFRAELREFWRVIDDFDLHTGSLGDELARLRGRAALDARTDAPADELIARWREALAIIGAVDRRLGVERPEELSSSALLRAAAGELRAGRAEPPRLLLVDDAQELGEGQLALLAACAAAGSAVWVFGDPDVATAAFHGERTRMLTALTSELARRGGVGGGGVTGGVAGAEPEQAAVLGTVHRHGREIRELVRGLTARVGAAGAGAQRSAASGDAAGRIDFARASSPAEQLGIVAHRMRSRRLGLEGGEPLDWGGMAVLCRSRSEAARISRGLASHQVPTGVVAGGIVLREHRIVRDLVGLLQHALDIARLDAEGVLHLLGGPVGGLDPVAVRRLRGALLMRERRAARDEERDPRATDEVVLDAFAFPGAEPAVDSAGGRALRRLGLIAAAGDRVREAGGTPREVLWAIWDGTRLADRWQDEALAGRGARSDEANRSLDAALGLFFALQRHEEQASEQPVSELLDDLLENTVPEDTLAQRGERAAVTVTTPQGAIGREFGFVAIIGPEDGVWPNTRSRGSLLGTVALERWLRGGEATAPSRKDTIHDELRLFAQACARAREELLVVAIADEDHHPSPFFGFGREHLRDGLPSSRLTLRGAVAALRRRVVADPSDGEALVSLSELVRAGVPGAHPDEWYGVLPPSTEAPLYAPIGRAGEGDGERRIPVSPSQLEAAERCPLDWAVTALGGSSGSVQASLGTLVHHALETAEGHDPEELLEAITSEWGKLPFDAEWESERAKSTAAAMARGLADYLREFDASDRRLIGRESGFAIPLGPAELRGKADRLELRETPTGAEITVLDLKTGATPPSKPEAERHAQLQAYQLGVMLGAFDLGASAIDSSATGHESEAVLGSEAGSGAGPGGAEEPGSEAASVHTGEPGPGAVRSGGARLLYVHPDAAKGAGFIERVQQPLSEEGRAELVQRVLAAAEIMAAGAFTARIEHHCSDPHQPGNCRLHIIEAVSRA